MNSVSVHDTDRILISIPQCTNPRYVRTYARMLEDAEGDVRPRRAYVPS